MKVVITIAAQVDLYDKSNVEELYSKLKTRFRKLLEPLFKNKSLRTNHSLEITEYPQVIVDRIGLRVEAEVSDTKIVSVQSYCIKNKLNFSYA